MRRSAHLVNGREIRATTRCITPRSPPATPLVIICHNHVDPSEKSKQLRLQNVAEKQSCVVVTKQQNLEYRHWANAKEKIPRNHAEVHTLAASLDPTAIRRGPAEGSRAVRTADTSCA